MSNTIANPFAVLSKDEEIQLLRDFVASLPRNSYISDFFQGCVPFFESSVRSDMPCTHADNLRDLESEHRAAQKNIADAKIELNKINQEIAKREKFKATVESDIQQVRTAFHKMATQLREGLTAIDRDLR